MRVTKKTLERVNEVYNMQVAGLRREQIVQASRASKHGWDVSPRTIDTYIALAKERFEEEAKVRRGAELGKAIARLDSLYAKADSRKDHRGALLVERERIELLDLKTPARTTCPTSTPSSTSCCADEPRRALSEAARGCRPRRAAPQRLGGRRALGQDDRHDRRLARLRAQRARRPAAHGGQDASAP